MEKIMDSNIYKVIIEIVVPILSSLLGGILAFLVARYTITQERKLDMKPYLITRDSSFESTNCSIIVFNSGYWKKSITEEKDGIVYHLNGIRLQNASNNSCVIQYIALNKKIYKLDYETIVHPNEAVIIKAKVHEDAKDAIGLITTDTALTSIKLGVYDMAHRLYEYELLFSIDGKNGIINVTDISCKTTKIIKREMDNENERKRT